MMDYFQTLQQRESELKQWLDNPDNKKSNAFEIVKQTLAEIQVKIEEEKTKTEL